MTNDTVTLELSGMVSIENFAKSVTSLRYLLDELTRTVGDGAEITWVVESLDAGSATMSMMALPVNETVPEQIENVVRAYGNVGRSLERGTPISYGGAVRTYAEQIANLVNGEVSAVRFETAETDWTVSDAEPVFDTEQVEASDEKLAADSGRTAPSTLTRSLPVRVKDTAYGAVEGRIQTLTSRGELRFTLYDTLFDRAVRCYLPADFGSEYMRDKWGRLAIVEGMVKRDPASGRPTAIREITDVIVRPEGDPDGYRQARGALSSGGTDAVTLVRESRDG